jgi:UDPglucose 6-dehydrogenase
MSTTVTNPLRITVIGIGYLGLVHAVCMAELGHEVLALDIDKAKVDSAAGGTASFFEPGLDPLLRKTLDAGRLRFTTDWAELGAFGQVHFVCVGTPQVPGGYAADLKYVHGAVDALAPHLTTDSLIVGKSTVPVGTARQLTERVRASAPAGNRVDLAWNPEFLREGYAVQDTLTPDRFVFGVTSGDAEELLRRVYAKPLAAGIPALSMDLETAELVKVAANSFLATKISFINVLAEMCEAVGADVLTLADSIGLDERIGRKFLSPGLGFGGGCLPKDIRAFRTVAEEKGVGSLVDLLRTVDTINLDRRERVVTLSREAVGDLSGKRVAVLGIAFKPNTDDIRDSPALDIATRLAAEGAVVSVHDPVAMGNAARLRPDLRYAESVSAAADGADLVVHLTEWADYRALDPVALAEMVAVPRLIDARCALDGDKWREAGWSVQVLGRP